MIKNILMWAIGLLVVCGAVSAGAEDKVTVYAAASLSNAITEVSAYYEKEHTANVVHSFAASSTLAKQIEHGAPADVYISADNKWMDYLQDKKLIKTESRKALLGNSLVLIAPKGRGFQVKFDKTFDLSKAFDGRLCTGDIDSVPAGIYAKQSLTHLNWWNGIKTRIVGAQDVRAALVFVERGECAAGIVYATDAKISDKVEVIGTFPEDSHVPIVYPVALVASSKLTGTGYFDFLQSATALEVFKKYGFNLNPVSK